MGGMGYMGGMGNMGGMGGMGMGGMGNMGMGGMGNMGMGGMGNMGMGGMGGMGRPMFFTPVAYQTGMRRVSLQTGMTTARPGANAPYQPTMVDWRRMLRLRTPLQPNWN
jgi:hypothetical protein